MLDKLSRSKFKSVLLVFFVLLGVFSCKKEKVALVHTVVVCPNRTDDIIIRYTRREDVYQAIRKAAENKKIQGTGENYTAIRFDHNRSLRIEKMSPEDMLKCSLREISPTVTERAKARKFFR